MRHIGRCHGITCHFCGEFWDESREGFPICVIIAILRQARSGHHITAIFTRHCSQPLLASGAARAGVPPPGVSTVHRAGHNALSFLRWRAQPTLRRHNVRPRHAARDRRQPFLVAFAFDPQRLFHLVVIFDRQRHDLAPAQFTAVQHGNHGRIADVYHVIGAGIEQAVQFPRLQRAPGAAARRMAEKIVSRKVLRDYEITGVARCGYRGLPDDSPGVTAVSSYPRREPKLPGRLPDKVCS
jgi:hypothetical protein